MFKSMTIEEISLRPGAEKLGHIQSITLFYDSVRNEIILNSDHKLYDICIELVEKYLEVDADKREKIKSKSKSIGCFSQEIKLLDDIIQIRLNKELNNPGLRQRYAKELKMIGGENSFWKELDFMRVLQLINGTDIFGAASVYSWGYIQGKKADRARRKQANAVKDSTNIQVTTLKQIITNRIKGINDLESLQEVYNLLIEKDKRLS